MAWSAPMPQPALGEAYMLGTGTHLGGEDITPRLA